MTQRGFPAITHSYNLLAMDFQCSIGISQSLKYSLIHTGHPFDHHAIFAGNMYAYSVIQASEWCVLVTLDQSVTHSGWLGTVTIILSLIPLTPTHAFTDPVRVQT